jgi:hypothetical protein
MQVDELRAPGRVIADRLDLMGFDHTYIMNFLDNTFEDLRRIGEHNADAYAQDVYMQKHIEIENEILPTLDGRQWIELVRSSHADLPKDAPPSLDNCRWLFHWFSYEDIPLIARACLVAFPDSEVILDVRELHEVWWEDPLSDPETLPSSMRWSDPVIVLTEGKNDTEFLRESLEILYPHLVDLIRFLDYDQKPDGGAGRVLNTVKAFAAAGIANRVVGVLDNDTAAAEALSTFDRARLPKHMEVIQYPDIELAKEYPTHGRPTLDAPDGSTATADINGLAASIELYLGSDVLAEQAGSLLPVQWTSFMTRMRRYQGQITGKPRIHKRFRRKCSLARESPTNITKQDWEGMRLILDTIRTTAAALLWSTVIYVDDAGIA